ncbi:MAG: hypothetical protein LBU76_06130 [Azoarcus sp.]|jgi:hypothetical protein|nr:hypothetical protein [Azoarcus sp.]
MKHILFAAAAMTALAGCATRQADIVSSTSHSLGLEPTEFTISNQQKSGMTTRYTATTNDGVRYSCYVSYVPPWAGGSSSDAMCNEMQSPGKKGKTAKGKKDPSCNELLRQAGKCK